jgi:hypothetical protein
MQIYHYKKIQEQSDKCKENGLFRHLGGREQGKKENAVSILAISWVQNFLQHIHSVYEKAKGFELQFIRNFALD